MRDTPFDATVLVVKYPIARPCRITTVNGTMQVNDVVVEPPIEVKPGDRVAIATDIRTLGQITWDEP